MASPSLPGSSPGILTGTGRARKSSFTSAAGFPGDDSDDEDSSFTSQVAGLTDTCCTPNLRCKPDLTRVQRTAHVWSLLTCCPPHLAERDRSVDQRQPRVVGVEQA